MYPGRYDTSFSFAADQSIDSITRTLAVTEKGFGVVESRQSLEQSEYTPTATTRDAGYPSCPLDPSRPLAQGRGIPMIRSSKSSGGNALSSEFPSICLVLALGYLLATLPMAQPGCMCSRSARRFCRVSPPAPAGERGLPLHAKGDRFLHARDRDGLGDPGIRDLKISPGKTTPSRSLRNLPHSRCREEESS
jgi:hypothetical protein